MVTVILCVRKNEIHYGQKHLNLLSSLSGLNSGLKLTTWGWLSESGLRNILLTGGQDLMGGLGGLGVLSGVFFR